MESHDGCIDSCTHVRDQLDPIVLDFELMEFSDCYTEEKSLREVASRLLVYHSRKDLARFKLIAEVRCALARRFIGPSVHDIDWFAVHKSGISKAVLAIALDQTSYALDGGTLKVRCDRRDSCYELTRGIPKIYAHHVLSTLTVCLRGYKKAVNGSRDRYLNTTCKVLQGAFASLRPA